MTTITLKINERSKKGKAFLEMARVFFEDSKEIEIIEYESIEPYLIPKLTVKEESFLKKVKRGANEAREISEGKRKGKSLAEFLDEI